MEMTRERCHSAQEDKKQLTLKVEELERLEVLGFLALLTFHFYPLPIVFFQGIEQLQSCSSPLCASRILCLCLSQKDLESVVVHWRVLWFCSMCYECFVRKDDVLHST